MKINNINVENYKKEINTIKNDESIPHDDKILRLTVLKAELLIYLRGRGFKFETV